MDMFSQLAVGRQLIPITCPVTLICIRQACRGKRCTHPAAFCTTALPSLRVKVNGDDPNRSYQCPLCDDVFSQSEVVVDGALTAFVSEHPDAAGALVRPLAGRLWAYRKAAKLSKPQACGKRKACPDQAGPNNAEPSTPHPCADRASNLHPDKVQREIKQDPERLSIAPQSLSHDLSGFPGASHPRHRPAPPPDQGMMDRAREADGEKYHRRVQAPAMPARSGEGGAAGRHTLPVPAPSRHLKPKAERKAERKVHLARSVLLDAAKKELIKRALWEDHPESAGDCLW